MLRHIAIAISVWALLMSGCAYELSLDGKLCDQIGNPCPPGYGCVPEGSQSVCRRSANDGGFPDGTDGTDGADGDDGGDDQSCLDQETRCAEDLQAIEICDQGTWNTTLCGPESYCDPFDPACKAYCDDDPGCGAWPGTSCDLSSRKCIALFTCSQSSDCDQTQTCVEASACVPTPLAAALDPDGGASSLNCYVSEPGPPPGSPASCNLEGRVVNFFSRQELADTIGLTIRIHSQANMFIGRRDNPLAETTAFDDNGVGQYTLTDVPTNVDLVLEVAGRTEADNPPPFGFATMYTFGIYLRADDCPTGTISLAAPSIYQTNYDGYSNPPGFDADASKGLLLGAVRDCADNKIAQATVGTTIPHEVLYFIGTNGQPDMGADATASSGFFVAANATPIQGLVDVLALSGAEPFSLWTRPVRVFPQAASLVLIEKPQAPRD